MHKKKLIKFCPCTSIPCQEKKNSAANFPLYPDQPKEKKIR